MGCIAVVGSRSIGLDAGWSLRQVTFVLETLIDEPITQELPGMIPWEFLRDDLAQILITGSVSPVQG